MRVLHTVRLDSLVTGIAPLTNRAALVLLAFSEGQLLTRGLASTRPEVLVLPDDGRAEVLYRKAITSGPVRLEGPPGDALDADQTILLKALRKTVVTDAKGREIRDFLYVAHPRSLVRLTEVNEEVRIRAMLADGRVRQARELLRRAGSEVSLETKVEVKQQYIMFLLENRRFREAAQKCSAFSRDLSKLYQGAQPRSKALLSSFAGGAGQEQVQQRVAQNLGHIDLKDRWFDWINRFNKEKALDELVPYVPTDIPELTDAVYDSIVGLLV